MEKLEAMQLELEQIPFAIVDHVMQALGIVKATAGNQPSAIIACSHAPDLNKQPVLIVILTRHRSMICS
jgi:hypothetical protein